jgi:DNA repair protein RecN (Recombination protein N)
MLSYLLIKNYALIEHLELYPDPALNIITGETGAGKSIMLGAIGLLLGNRADGKALYNPNEKCVIEGHFDISGYFIQHIFEEEELDYETTCLIRREISPSGKSRAFVNDTPVNLEMLKRITTELMDVHSQHDTTLLGSNEYQLQIIDTFAQNESILARYHEHFVVYRKAQDTLERLHNEATDIKKEFNYNSFLFEELAKAKLKAGEQEEMEQELIILENAEEVKTRLQASFEGLSNLDTGIIGQLQSLVNHINPIASYATVYDLLRHRLQSCLIELKDIAEEIESEEESVELDNEKIVTIDERLHLLYNLQHKHQVKTIDELLTIQQSLEQKVSKVLNLDEALAKAQEAVVKAEKTMLKAAQVLSDSRKKILKTIEKEVATLLHELGMPNANMTVQHQAVKPNSMGIDVIHFLFSANKGIAPQQLKNVASGGEFSRLMLAVKYILATKRSLPTIIFDEIDTGVSGEISIKMGNMMKDMARGHQIIAITHLHQIAAKGDAHYYVYKDHSASRTVSRIKKLSTEERVMEIAQMIGGDNPSKAIIENAREILGETK